MRKAGWALMLLWALHALAAAQNAPVQIQASTGSGLKIDGLENSVVVVQACRKADTSQMQCSSTRYHPVRGSIDTGRDKPIPGNFVGIDSAGVFWSAVGTHPIPIAGTSLTGKLAELSVGDWLITVKTPDVRREVVLGASVVRAAQAPFQLRPVTKGDVKGFLYTPTKSSQASAAVFVIGGCPEGGQTTGLLAFLASQGFTVFHALYTKSNNPASSFKCAGELSLLEDELAWFKSNVDSRNLFLLGMSMGVEGALWLANLSNTDLRGLMLINGSNIQLPPTLSYPWTYHGKALTHLPTNPGTVWRRFKSGGEQTAKRMLGEAPMRNQRKVMEEELDGYTIPELTKYAIPLNCKIPHSFLFSENDELVPVKHTLAVIEQQCGKRAEIAVNPRAAHSSMEIGNTELWRCMRSQEPEVSKEECFANIRAGIQNAARLVAFIKRLATR